MASANKSKGGRPSKAILDIGKTFGLLTVVQLSKVRLRQSIMWCVCACDPSREFEMQWRHIRSSKNQNCGCLPRVSQRRVTPEHRAAKIAAWKASNSEKMKVIGKQWRKDNWPTLVKKKMQWKRDNPEKVSAIAKKFREAHPDRVQAGKSKYRARKLGAVVGDPAVILAWESAWKARRRVRCYWCQGLFSPKVCHTDHVIALNARGEHEVGNLCVSCGPCNLKKNDRTVQVWNGLLSEPVLL